MYHPKHFLHFFHSFSFRGSLAILFLCLSFSLGTGVSISSQAADTEDPIKIACVGDSITYGYTSSNPTYHSYPSQLQNLLGDGYVVNNYGKSGFTLMKSGDKSYWTTSEYTASQSFLPDIVILMLGTNDSKEVNWAHKDEFLSDLEEMITIYQNLDSHPTVYVCTSPRMPVEQEKEGGLVNQVIEEEIVPLQKQAAQDTGCTLLDVNAFSHTDLEDEDFKDYAHPTELGYQKLANFFYGALTNQKVSMEIIDDADFSYSAGSGWVAGSISSGTMNGEAGTEHYAVVTEETASEYSYEITFTGTRIQVYGQLSPNHGIVSYSVDGSDPVEVDSYASSRSVHTLLFQASGLSLGTHTLTATATGRTNTSAKNDCIQVDYAKVFTETSAVETPTETETETETESETPVSETSSTEVHDKETPVQKTPSTGTSAASVTLAKPILKAKRSGTKVTLSWKKVAKATGYQLQVKTGKGRYKQLTKKTYKKLSYTKKKLKKGTTYSFRVRSYGRSGNGKVIYSGWSKVVKIKIA
jgi:lysophospholipase L1-like esterase